MRFPTLRNGHRGAVTRAQLSKATMAAYSESYSNAGTGLSKFTFLRGPSDFVADGGLFKLVLTHSVNSAYYTWTVVKIDNNAGVIVEYFNQGNTELTLWFTDDTLDLAITIIG